MRQLLRRILNLADGTSIALLLAALGVVLILQGWKSRIPNFDMLTTIDAAQQVIDHGRLPDRGVVTSFGSFTPPGLTWLMLPGLALFRDPRLFESVGSLGALRRHAARYFSGGASILWTTMRARRRRPLWLLPAGPHRSEAPCSTGIRFSSSSSGLSIGSRGGRTKTTRAGSPPRS